MPGCKCIFYERKKKERKTITETQAPRICGKSQKGNYWYITQGPIDLSTTDLKGLEVENPGKVSFFAPCRIFFKRKITFKWGMNFLNEKVFLKNVLKVAFLR